MQPNSELPRCSTYGTINLKEQQNCDIPAYLHVLSFIMTTAITELNWRHFGQMILTSHFTLVIVGLSERGNAFNALKTNGLVTF